MKKLSLLLVIIPAFCFSQRLNPKDINPSLLDSITYNILSKTLAPSDIHLPFSGFEIIDARFDTSKLGFEIHKKYDNISYKDFKKIKLVGGIQKSLEEFYNDYYKLCFKNTDSKLMIVLKTLWIDNTPSPEYKERRNYELVTEAYQNIYLKFEYYLKMQNVYYPLIRIDTVYQLTEQNLSASDIKFKRNDLSFLLYVIKSVVEKYDFENLISKIDNKRKLKMTSIDSFNNKRLSLPVLTEVLKKGVFLNFKEFCNNSPSISAYEIKKNKKEELLYAKGDSASIKKYWVISDSLGLHFKFSDNNPVKEAGNTFEFFIYSGVYLPKTMVGNLMGAIPDKTFSTREVYGENRINAGNGARLQYVLVPRQINMETGEIY